MMGITSRSSFWRGALLLTRLVLGAAFIYAGWIKALDPVGFADSVNSFAILPSILISPFALAMPIFEIFSGILILTGIPARLGAFALLCLTGVFSIALVSAILRGLSVNCGCFGPSASTTNPWVDLGRDILIIVGCAAVYRG